MNTPALATAILRPCGCDPRAEHAMDCGARFHTCTHERHAPHRCACVIGRDHNEAQLNALLEPAAHLDGVSSQGRTIGGAVEGTRGDQAS